METFDTYGAMEDLRYQLTYWVNGHQVQTYAYISGIKALEHFDAIQHTINDLGGVMPSVSIKSYGIRLDDYKLNKTMIKRSRGMELESIEVMCMDLPKEEEVTNTYSLADELQKAIAGMDDFELQAEIDLAELSRFYAQEDGNEQILKEATERKRKLENAYTNRYMY